MGLYFSGDLTEMSKLSSTVKAWVSLLEVTTDDFAFLPLIIAGSESGKDPSLLSETKFDFPALVASCWEEAFCQLWLSFFPGWNWQQNFLQHPPCS